MRFLALFILLVLGVAQAQIPKAETRLKGSEVPERLNQAVAAAQEKLGGSGLRGRVELLPDGPNFILRVTGSRSLQEAEAVVGELTRPTFVQPDLERRSELEEKLLALRKDRTRLTGARKKLIEKTKLNPLGKEVEGLQDEIAALEAEEAEPEPQELTSEKARLAKLQGTYSDDSEVVRAQLKVVTELESQQPSRLPRDRKLAFKRSRLDRLLKQIKALRQKELTRLAGIDEALQANQRHETKINEALSQIATLKEEPPDIEVLSPPVKVEAPPPPEPSGRRILGYTLALVLILVIAVISSRPVKENPRKTRRRKKEEEIQD